MARRPKPPKIREITKNSETIYRLEYYDPITGKRHRPIGGTTRSEAEEEATRIYNKMRDRWLGLEVTPPPDIGISELIENYLKSKHRITGSTLSRYRSLNDHFLLFIQNEMPKLKKVSQVKNAHLETMLENLHHSGRKPRTLNAVIQQIKALFQYAVKEGYIESNPANSIERYREKGKRGFREFWDEDEVKRILEEVKPQWRDGLEFIYNTGLRKAELIYLTWDDVSIDESVPTIAIQAKEGWDPKSNARIVPLNIKAIDLTNKQNHSEEHNWVFKGPGGGQIHRDKVYRELKRALNVLDMEGDVHKLRHSFASNLLRKGAGIEKVKALLGHTKIDTTMIYSHHRPSDLKKTVDILNDEEEDS